MTKSESIARASESKSFKRLNPHFFGASVADRDDGLPREKRIRQDSKPIMNKLEQEWFNILSAQYPNYPRPKAQSKKYRTSRSSWYKPDVTASSWPVTAGPAQETAWECKGPKEMKNVARGILSLKVAASQWPEVRFILVWKENGIWQEQVVLP